MEKAAVVLVQCRKTGEWYNPQEQFDKRMNDPVVLEMFKRMRNK